MDRSGKGVRLLAEQLLEAPETPLDAAETQEALAYEAQICEYSVGESLTVEQLIRSRKSEAPLFFPEAFLRGKVGLFNGIQPAGVETAEDVYAWLARVVRNRSVTVADMREMARQSNVYYKEEMTQAILRDQRPDEALLEAAPIVIDPEAALRFAEAGLRARDFLMDQRQQYGRDVAGVAGARRAFVDIYTKRINGMVTGDVTVMETLIEQSRRIGDSHMIERASSVIPKGLRVAADGPGQHRLNKRLEFVRSGIGYDDEGRATAADRGVFERLEDLPPVDEQAPAFSPEQQARLKAAYMDKETIHDVIEKIIAEAGMLSREPASTWRPGRGHRAIDELFQVVYQPIKGTLAVNGDDGVILTPNGSRSVYDVLVVTCHELTHINQTQADRALGGVLRIGALKGRRVSMLREAGANAQQRRLERQLFGVSKPIAPTYASAIRVFEAGGDLFDATKAFYEVKQKMTSVDAMTAAREAADRVLRLRGMRGVNSQPMAYGEERLMVTDLEGASARIVQRVAQITSLDLDDQLRLHRFGLLPLSDVQTIEWVPILMRHMEPYIDAVLRSVEHEHKDDRPGL